MEKPEKIPLDTPNATLTTPAKLFRPKSILLTQSKEVLRNHHFFIFFSQNFLRTRRLTFRTPCRQCLAKSWTFSLKVRKSVRNHRFFKKKMLKIFLWKRRVQLWQPLPNCVAQNPIFFTQSTKLLQNHQNHHFFKIFLSQNFSPDT